MRRKSNKAPGRIPLSAWLGYLLAVTFLATGVTFSSYITTTGGGDIARVARFSFAQDGMSTPIKVNLVPGETQAHELKVTNNSEVAVDYVVTVENTTGNLPLIFKMQLDGGTPVLLTQHGNIWTYTETLPPTTTQEERTYTLLITWDATDPANRDPSFSGMVDAVTVEAQALQKD